MRVGSIPFVAALFFAGNACSPPPPAGVLVTVRGTVTIANACEGKLPDQVHVTANLLTDKGTVIGVAGGDFALAAAGPVSVANFTLTSRVIGSAPEWEITAVTRTPTNKPVCENPDEMKCAAGKTCQDLATKSKGSTPVGTPIDYEISCKCA